jgi:hypothetical protein
VEYSSSKKVAIDEDRRLVEEREDSHDVDDDVDDDDDDGALGESLVEWGPVEVTLIRPRRRRFSSSASFNAHSLSSSSRTVSSRSAELFPNLDSSRN